jgi:hypothetical protein
MQAAQAAITVALQCVQLLLLENFFDQQSPQKTATQNT